jgi:hypothetical protein
MAQQVAEGDFEIVFYHEAEGLTPKYALNT